jgi:hypothetical protein
VAEVRRLVLALVEREEHHAFHLSWSRWRRAHQAIAARCHTARRGRGRDRPLPSAASTSATPTATAVTGAEWQVLLPLLPPQRPRVGRPRHDHRTVLGGIVWVVRGHASWRDLPTEYGKWQTAYQRYRLWRASGLWQRIATALGLEVDADVTEVAL